MHESEVNEIREYLQTEFERILFKAVLDQVRRDDDPLRANNFAYALRELLRHVLARLSPDKDVMESPWYSEVRNDRGKVVVTRNQRIKFAIQGFLDDEFVADILKSDYTDEVKKLRDQIENLNRYTHIQPECFNVSTEEVDKLCRGALVAMAGVFRSMFDCRERTLKALSEAVNRNVTSHVIEESLEEFYDFSTHYEVDEVVVDRLDCTGFNGDEIYGTVSGTIGVKLLYGSAKDRERGDGAEMDASAEFTCEVLILASDLTSISIVEGTFELDTEELESSWQGDVDEDF